MIDAAVAFGANLGNPPETFARAIGILARERDVSVTDRSSLWRSAPWGLTDQPDFVNAVARLSTDMPALELLELLKSVEIDFGRTEGPRNAPRPLDLDLLWYGAERRADTELTLPHPGLSARSFVLEPAAEVAPQWRDPATGRTILQMRDLLRVDPSRTECVRLEGTRLGELRGLVAGCLS
ncbi:MAG: 2-amino-4-hydroxy-6-hydroxymethyldihydropteridine diphosphokinase [Gemmatimonadetes bacterium]|nr:2-amino-4-hydroxy-6-hydroxymethyldihydropteridine diphosphokinase [Gemmatimonadota bacterium]